MPKQRYPDKVVSELSESSFFRSRAGAAEPTQPQAAAPTRTPRRVKAQTTTEPVIPRHHDTVIPEQADMVERIRKAVRQVGRESATQRLTKDEKDRLKDIIYTYDRQGIETSINEIARIGINFLCQDFDDNGENSILARVLQRLNA